MSHRYLRQSEKIILIYLLVQQTRIIFLIEKNGKTIS